MKITVLICTIVYLTFSTCQIGAHSSTLNPISRVVATAIKTQTAASSAPSSVVGNEEIVEKLCTRQEKYNETKLVEIIKPITVRYFAWCAAVPPRCSRYRIQNETEIQLVPVEKTREIKICCEGFLEIDSENGKKCKKDKDFTRTNSVPLSSSTEENFGACGGVLKKDSGNFQLQNSDFQSLGGKTGRYLCTFIIQTSQGNSMRFKLNEMAQEETRVNLYPENYFAGFENPRENLKTLNQSNVNSTIEVKGNFLTVLISGIKNGENGNQTDSLVSFGWESLPKTEWISAIPASTSSSASHHTTEKGRIIWDGIQSVKGQTSQQPTSADLKNFNLNFNLIQVSVKKGIQNSKTSSLALQLSAEFSSCDDFDPCRCNSIQIYRILSDGNLQLVSRYCGVSIENLKIKNLPMQILTVAQISSKTVSNSACGNKFVEISWETEEKDKSNSVSCADSTTQNKNLKCPGLEVDLEPCTCSAGFGLDLRCSGQDVTQVTINNLFSAVRKVNNLRENDLLHFAHLTITNTILKTLDLTPLLKSSGQEVAIVRNRQLTSIKVNKVNTVNIGNIGNSQRSARSPDEQISTEELRIQYNPLTNSGVGDLLACFDPQKLIKLTLKNLKIQGSSSSFPVNGSVVEFLPGLSSFINLLELHLDDNEIRELGGGQFQRNSKLTQLTLGSADQTLKRIGPNAFLFDNNSSSEYANEPSTLRIYLGSSGLKNQNFINSQSTSTSTSTGEDLLGLTSLKRPVTLDLTHNEIDHLPESIFKKFLLSNSQNKIDMQGNLLQCDNKMKWLKDNRNLLESQVLNTRCSNDRGRKSVFETSLI